MKFKAAVALALLVVCTGVFAQDQKQPEMSPEQKAMMEAWMKYMTPSEGHKVLNAMVGTFDAKVTNWMAPGAPPAVSTGTEENTWILGGRYIESKFTGSFMGQPYQGIGYTGYDNAKKQYFGTWMDNMGTGMMTSYGGASTDGGKSWMYTSMMTDPMTGKDSSGQTKVTMTDKDHFTMEMWGPGPDGKSFKMMEIAYSRKK